jgi:hypothetical protein
MTSPGSNTSSGSYRSDRLSKDRQPVKLFAHLLHGVNRAGRRVIDPDQSACRSGPRQLGGSAHRSPATTGSGGAVHPGWARLCNPARAARAVWPASGWCPSSSATRPTSSSRSWSTHSRSARWCPLICTPTTTSTPSFWTGTSASDPGTARWCGRHRVSRSGRPYGFVPSPLRRV